MDLLYLLVAQMPRCPDLVIGRQMDKTTLSLVHVCGVMNKLTKYTGVGIENCDRMTCPQHILNTCVQEWIIRKGREYWTHYIPHVICVWSYVTSRLAHLTKLKGLNTWFFSGLWRIEAFSWLSCKILHERSFCIVIYQHFKLKSCSCCLHSRPRLQWAIWIKCMTFRKHLIWGI